MGPLRADSWLTGFNTSLTLKTHKNTIPSQPALGEVLSKLELSLPTPNLRHGDDGEDGDKPRFIKEATVCSRLQTFPHSRTKRSFLPLYHRASTNFVLA